MSRQPITKTSPKGMPLGFVCVCGDAVEFGTYVFAHFRIDLSYTCEKCGRKFIIRNGRAILKK